MVLTIDMMHERVPSNKMRSQLQSKNAVLTANIAEKDVLHTIYY